MNFYRFPEVNVIGIETMLREIEARPQLWAWDTRRQEKVAVQKESISIPLRVGIPENNVHINHWQDSKDSPLYRYFPACRSFLEAFTGHYGAPWHERPSSSFLLANRSIHTSMKVPTIPSVIGFT